MISSIWLRVSPNDNLGSRFGQAEYRLLTHFHLGIPLFPHAAAGSPCEDCGEALDVYGDHLVACGCANTWGRHNHVLRIVNEISQVAGYHTAMEVAVSAKERPADLLMVFDTS